jgi:CheY-like chemotaxis protein
MVLDAGEKMLKRLGYEVLLAGSGREALELYEKNKILRKLVLQLFLTFTGETLY